MPKPPPEPSERAERLVRAYEVWGNPVREALFAFIRDNPGLFFGEIYEDFRPKAEEITGENFPEPSLARHLNKLRDTGIIVTDPPVGQIRRGRPPRYFTDTGVTDALIDAVIKEISAYRSDS